MPDSISTPAQSPVESSAGGFNPFQVSETAGVTPSQTTQPTQTQPAQTTTQSPGTVTQPSVTTPPPPAPTTTTPAEQAPGTQPATQTSTQAPLSLTPEQLATLTNAIRSGNTPNTQQTQTQTQEVADPNDPDVTKMSQEDFDKHFNVVRVDEGVLTKIFAGGPEGVAALNDTLHSVARMGATLALRQVNKEFRRFDQHIQTQYGSVRDKHIQNERDQHAQAFFKEYDGFTTAHTPILMAVYEQLQREGFTNSDPRQVYAKVAERASQWMQSINPAFAPKKSPANGTQSTQTTGSAPVAGSTTNPPPSQMSQLVTTSTGTGAPTGAAAGQLNDAQRIFGNLG